MNYFSITQFFIVYKNILSNNMYSTKTLTQHIGLKYRKFHAYIVGCVLYKGPYANYFHCSKCGRAKFKQVGRTQVLEKIWCHFPKITRLKRMCQSPSMAKLLQWHDKNKSTNGLVHNAAIKYQNMATHWEDMARFCKWPMEFEVSHIHKWVHSILRKIVPMVHIGHLHSNLQPTIAVDNKAVFHIGCIAYPRQEKC
jgi:hypothetical protein